MAIEIDQSGKLEQLNTNTVISAANDQSRSIVIKTSTKRRIIQTLRKSVVPSKDLIPIAFSVLLFLLFREFKTLPFKIVIDEEYTGKDELIKETLKKLFSKSKFKNWKGIIVIGRVGKSSPAHKLCWSIHRKKDFKNITKISAEEFFENWS